MKKAVSFRFKKNTLIILNRLKEKFHTTKTDIVEKALAFYAEEKLKSDNPLMKHAGIFSAEEADAMLVDIKKSRRNKNIKVEF